jgi:hypothetical protein
VTTAGRRRGSETQIIVADYFRANGFPYCTPVGGGITGADLLNCIGLAPEVKGVRDWSPQKWLRQADRNAGDNLPFVVERPQGYGPASVEDWAMVFRLKNGLWLLRQAGYGDPLEEQAS